MCESIESGSRGGYVQEEPSSSCRKACADCRRQKPARAQNLPRWLAGRLVLHEMHKLSARGVCVLSE